MADSRFDTLFALRCRSHSSVPVSQCCLHSLLPTRLCLPCPHLILSLLPPSAVFREAIVHGGSLVSRLSSSLPRCTARHHIVVIIIIVVISLSSHHSDNKPLLPARFLSRSPILLFSPFLAHILTSSSFSEHSFLSLPPNPRRLESRLSRRQAYSNVVVAVSLYCRHIIKIIAPSLLYR